MVKQFVYIFLLLTIITVSLYLVYIQFTGECVEGFDANNYIGTYDDYPDRIIGTARGDRITNPVNTAEECNNIASQRGHPYFGIEWRECHTGFLDTTSTPKEYRPMKNTDRDGNIYKDANGNPTNQIRNVVYGWDGNPSVNKLNSKGYGVTIPLSSKDGTATPAGGGWLMSVYKTDSNTTFNSHNASTKTFQGTSSSSSTYEYCTSCKDWMVVYGWDKTPVPD